MFFKLLRLYLSVAVTTATTFNFPDDFIFGVASSSYQIEGGWNTSGKGENIWDRFTHLHPELIKDHTNGDIACDSYNKWRDDVQILKELGVNFYRFSLSWARLMPNGTPNIVNSDGIRYYNDLINELLANGIEPMVTLYHWELPQVLQDSGGFLNEDISEYFKEYADLVFRSFGDRVKKWITFNEPIMICKSGYSTGEFAPGINEEGVGGYICGRMLLLAHAKAYHLYNNKYRPLQDGKIGITISSIWSEPKTDDPIDIEAAQRNILMEFGWFAHPIFSENGNYPKIMIQRIAAISAAEGFSNSRLPSFSTEEVKYIKGTSDFFGLNHYSSRLISHIDISITAPTSEWKDIGALKEQDPSWGLSGLPWLRVVPWGLRKLLVWIKETYNNPPVYITENGFGDLGGKEDHGRINYYRLYLNATLEAIYKDGCNVQGYTAWSLMDNMEWDDGYTSKFGLFHVDFEDPNRPRTPKASADFYKDVIMTRTVPGA